MGARGEGWVRGNVVAWTASDGPGELPPVPLRRVALVAVLAAGVAGWGLLTSDQVCPEHSMLIDITASFAIVLTVMAIVAALRSSVLAAPLVLAASAFGLGIGVVDALHDVTRSRVVAIGFALAALASGFSAVQSVGLRLWERRVLNDAAAPAEMGLTLPEQVADSGTIDEPSVVGARSHSLTSFETDAD